MIKLEGTTKKALTILILWSFLSLSLLGLLMMSEGNMQTGQTAISPCPYMQGQMSLCSMSVFDHINAWESSLRSVPVKNILQLLAVGIFALLALVLFRKTQLQFESKERRLMRFLERIRLFIPQFYTQLFREGILNSRAY